MFYVISTAKLTAQTTETILYTYDDLDRVIRAEYGDGTQVEYVYDALGNRYIKRTILSGSPANNPPDIPSNPAPSNSTTGVFRFPDLSWTGGDPDSGDIVVYDIYFGKSSPPPHIGTFTQNSHNIGQLEPLTTYYWQVVSRDSRNASSAGPVWTFTTTDRDDFDGDGWTDTFEIDYGSDPLDPASLPPDKDGDGIIDPLDTDDDNDGYSDDDEILAGSDPLDASSLPADNDSDFIIDIIDTDDDNDGMPDVWETTYGLDPFDPADAFLDTDGDTFINMVEKVNGLDPTVAEEALATVAGDGTAGYSGDGSGAVFAQLSGPIGAAVDVSGNLYIADPHNNRIRKVDTSGIITTVAGNGIGGFSGDGGIAEDAQLSSPSDVALDSSGNYYIADNGNNRIRKVDTSGIITTVAGDGTWGYSGDEGLAVNAQLALPSGVCIDGVGNIYIADSGNNLIRKVDTTGIISTVAGNGTRGYSGDGGPATDAQLDLEFPTGIAVDASGLYISDTGNNRIRKVDTSGIMTTVVGNGTYGYSGDGGLAVNAHLRYPYGVAVDNIGNIYVIDSYNYRIRKVDATGVITTVAGSGTNGYSGDGGPGVDAQLSSSRGITVDGFGSVYIADTGNNRIRKINPDFDGDGYTNVDEGTAGSDPLDEASLPADNDGDYISDATDADDDNDGYLDTDEVAAGSDPLYASSVPVDTDGDLIPDVIDTDDDNDGMMDVWETTYGLDPLDASDASLDSDGDTFINLVESVNGLNPTVAEEAISTIAGEGTGGYSGDGGYALNSQVNKPYGTVVDASGNLYISDYSNHRIRKVDTSGVITTVAGNGTNGYSGDGGPAVDAQLWNPTGVAVDLSGNLYIADFYNNRIRKVDTSGVITTVAGNGSWGYSGDGGPAVDAKRYYPSGVVLDASGNLYIADRYNHRIRKVNTAGIIITVAGNGTYGYSGDGGLALDAQLYYPSGVVVDTTGNLYIADRNNNRIRKVDATGVITTAAGNGAYGYSGDGGPADAAQLYNPSGVSVDVIGNLYIADYNNHRIRKVDTAGVITTVAGTGTRDYSGDGGPADGAQLYNPTGVTVAVSGNIYIADYNNHRIRKINPDFDGDGYTNADEGAAGSDPLDETSLPADNDGDYVSDVTDTDDDNDGYLDSDESAAGSDPFDAFSIPVDTDGDFIPDVIDTDDDGDGMPDDWETTYGLDPLDASDASLDSDGDTILNLVEYVSGLDPTVAEEVIVTVAGDGTYGYSGDGGLAIQAQVYNPYGTAVDGSGNLYIADYNNHRVRSAAVDARLNYPTGVAVDLSGNIFIADYYNHRVRKVDTSGIITTVAGNGTRGYSGDGDTSVDARLNYPIGIAVDGTGNVYIADYYNNRIRKVDTAGIITTVAGNGIRGYSGDGGPAADAELYYPEGVALDTSGNLYIADGSNHRIRKVDVSGVITTVAGIGTRGYSGDGGPADAAQLYKPSGVSVDTIGNLYIADYYNHRIRKVDTVGIITTVVGSGKYGYSGDGGPGEDSQLYNPTGVSVDASGILYIADYNNNRIRKFVQSANTNQ
ncbi:MAG: hypothetical protein SCALA701_10040 [Candidatus Scalindua sp.]|nr:MAG: hypothetical protein SCALA701_10040 [Candidatus Scalindua sp.]